MCENIEVSVICNAYNHEKYIRSALDGFVMQKTTFLFEVLIHDDASTDGTAAIIREYEQRYPEIMKPIYETENQYSKGDGSLGRIQYGRVRGKYIAFCEGDDYWTDPLKLQKQHDALEEHSEVDICAHAALTSHDNIVTGQVAPCSCETIFPVEKVILGGGGFVATASLMYRASIRKNPLPFFTMLTYDYTLQILGSLRGGMLYLPDVMSVYRLATEGSWTQRMRGDLAKLNAHYKRVEEMLLCLDRDTEGKYSDVIRKKILKNHFSNLQINRKYKQMLSPEYREIFRALPVTKRIKLYIMAWFPWIVTLKQKITKSV